MNKDSFYFPHFYNARNDRKIRRLRKELGVEGYGIYFMLLEVLRDQKDFRYPMQDIDLLADEFKTSDQKLRVVICNYDLFRVDEDEFFFSPKFIEYLSPYLESKQRNRVNGIKGNLIKHGYARKDELQGLSDEEILRLNENKSLLSGGESQGDSGGGRKKSKVKKSKEKENIRKQVATVPTLSDVQEYFKQKGYGVELASKFYEYYNEPMKDRGGRVWKDQKGNTVVNWKQKALAVWMKKDNKTEHQPSYHKFI